VTSRHIPHARDAEEAIIGTLLVDNSRWDDVRAAITDTDFHDREFRRMFVHIGDEITAGKNVDLLTMTEDGFNVVELTRAINTVGSTIMTGEYIGLVRDRALRREALSQASELARAAYDLEHDIETALDGHMGKVQQMGKVDERLVVPVAQAASELWDMLEQLGKGINLAVETPWKAINTLIGGFIPPELTVLASRPSMGKSQWAIQVADSFIRRGLRVLFHDMETDKVSILRRMALMRSGVDWMKFRMGIQTADDIAKVSEAAVELMQAEGLWIVDKRIPVEEFAWVVRRLHREHKLDLVIVDYLQLYPTAGRNRVVEVGQVASTLKDIAKYNQLPVLATAQLRRITERADKEPTMDDLRESGEIEQAADLIIGMHRAAYYNPMLGADDGSGPTKFSVLKARDGVRGTFTNLYWAASRLRFESVAPQLERVMGSRGITPTKSPAMEEPTLFPPDPEVETGLRVAGTEDRTGDGGEGPRKLEPHEEGRGEVQRTGPDGLEALPNHVADAEGGRNRGGVDKADREGGEEDEPYWDR